MLDIKMYNRAGQTIILSDAPKFWQTEILNFQLRLKWFWRVEIID